MTTWLKENWRWAILNGVALLALFSLLRDTRRAGVFESDFTPLIESGKWAIRFLLLSLAMTPLNTLFGWRPGIKLRKSAGLWGFGFGLLHFAFYLVSLGWEWLASLIPHEMAGIGLLSLRILTPTAATSTRWAMKRLGKWWKRVHRMVYLAGILAVVHGLLESITSKRVAVTDHDAQYELWIYIVLLTVLLAVRIPVIRTALASLRQGRTKREQPA